MAADVAPRLLGSLLIREYKGQRLVGRIVEAEAYDQTDAASHSYHGSTPRTDVMFGPAGYLYVYFTYGMHYCMNVVCGPKGMGAAVLIRAVEPLNGLEAMESNRRGKTGIELTNGPAKVCQAFAIDRAWNGHDLRAEPFRLQLETSLPAEVVMQTTRIGITKAADVPWRFYVKGNTYISRP